MKYTDINKLFTEKVAEYILKGYTLNSSTMKGSQGERAKVDLTDGTEIIRICVVDFTDEEHWFLHGTEVLVGRATDNVQPDTESTWSVIWTSNLEVLSEDRFYEVDETEAGKVYGTRDEAVRARAARR